jgi:hypothetical protein
MVAISENKVFSKSRAQISYTKKERGPDSELELIHRMIKVKTQQDCWQSYLTS